MSMKDYREIQDKIAAIYAKADSEASSLRALADDIASNLRTKTDYYTKKLTENSNERQRLLHDLAQVQAQS